MKKTKQLSCQFGDLIASLYDEAEKETNNKKLQSLIVTLALLDLRGHIKRRGTFKKQPEAA